jgi:RimJ/RimL family protein N-acetyltransferase
VLPNVPSPYRLDDAVQFVAEIAPMLWREGRGANFAVEVVKGGVLAGACGLTIGDESVPEVGYWIAPSQRRRGFATRAVQLLVKWATHQAGFDHLDLYVRIGNAASCGVAEKAGFVRQEIVQDRVRFHRG